MSKLFKQLLFIALIPFLLLTTTPNVSAHGFDMGTSHWTIDRNEIKATLEFGNLSLIKELGKRSDELYTDSDEQLQQMAVNIIQPYIKKKLFISINDKNYPITVKKLIRSDDNIFTILLSVNSIDFKGQNNLVKIYYYLFFEETSNTHINQARIFLPNSSENGISHLFSSDTPVWEGTVKGTPTNPAAPDDSDAKIWTFILIGIKHILTGCDHILFLLALIVIGLSLNEVLKIITSFTIAHSISLFLAVFQIVTLDSKFVESAIALSICYLLLKIC